MFFRFFFLTWKKVRDQQTSAALGLPSRIRNEDCEVMELQPSDFDEDDCLAPSEFFPKPPAAHVSYVILMAQLAKMCKHTVIDLFLTTGFPDLQYCSRRGCHKSISARAIKTD